MRTPRRIPRRARRTRTRWLTGSILLLASVAPLPGADAHAQTPTTIGLVLDGPLGRMTDVRARLAREITAVLGTDRPVRLEAAHEYVGDWTADGIRAAIGDALAAPEVDLVVVFGVVGASIAADLGSLAKPVVAAPVVEAGVRGFPSESVAVANGLYYVGPEFSRAPLELFREVFGVSRVAVIGPPAFAAAADAQARRFAEAAGLRAAWVVPASDDPVETVARIPAEADGVYVLPVLRWSEADLRALASGLGARRLPSLSWAGADEVELGLLAASTPQALLDRISRWVAVTVEAITRERPAGVVPSAFLVQEQLTLNRERIASLGVSPRWRALLDAAYVGDEVPAGLEPLNLPAAVALALESNLDLLAAGRGVEAGAASARLAGAPLLPQVSLGGSTRWLGGNLLGSAVALPSSGALTGSGSFSLPLYDDRRWADYSIERSLQRSRVHTFTAQQLDVAQAAAVTYVGVLGQRTLVRIQRANLELTRSNLEIARIREATGGGRLAEVYRWQTEVASAQDALVRATTNSALVEQELNRLLRRPLTSPVILSGLAVDDPDVLADASAVGPYIDDPAAFDAFRAFLVAEAMEVSPELRALDAQTAAFERQRTAANRAFWLPSFGLEAFGLNRFAQWGGTQSTGDSGFWTIAIVGRYPLFTGLGRFAESDRSARELERIELEGQAVRQRVDQRVGTALLELRGALVGLEVAREAAEAARRNYALTEESYRQGVGAIIMVLDAQTTAVAAELRAATAAYEVLVGLANVQRAVGRFDLFGQTEGREAFLQRLDEYFAEAGVEVRR